MTAPATPPSPARLVVLVSGGGTLLQALLDASAGDGSEPAPFTVAAVGADTDAPALRRAEAAGVPTFVVPLAASADRSAWDAALARAVADHSPDLLVCAGFMRILGPAVLAAFGGRTVNTHPALLPAFPGAHGVRDALGHGVRVTGATAHLVDAGVDTGPILDQRAVPVEQEDDEASLHERIKVVERAMLVDVLTRMVRTGWTVTGRKVSFP